MNSLKIEAHLKAAKVYAELSHAQRLKVGAVLVKDNRIISIGYNGMPSGMDNECEYVVTAPDGSPVIHTKPEVVHAEANSILFAAREGIPTNGCTMIATHSPCYECSKMIIQSGIKEVYYETPYRVKDSIDFLIKAGVEVVKI